jgi:hypothetical protein
VSSAKKVYGVKIPILNEIVRKIKKPNFNLVEKLWKDRAFEEKLLAAKILEKISKKNPKKRFN